MTRPTKALIRLQSIRDNYQLAQQLSQNAYAVIKANAYGHGLIPVARALHANDLDGLAVACVDEAIQLRNAGIRSEILVLEGGYNRDEWLLAIDHDLSMVMHHQSQLEDLAACKGSADIESLKIWLKADTGMNRIGFRCEDIPSQRQELQQLGIRVRTLMTHFASADDRTNPQTLEQLEAFHTQRIEGELISSNNSAGITNWPEAQDDISRPGIMLYGASPLGFNSTPPSAMAHIEQLKPAMSLISEVISIRDIKAGETVGYGQDWTAKSNTTIAIIAIGYGDGYPRQAPSGTPVLIAGKRYPLAGRVSMDMIAVDIGQESNLAVGAEVELWGERLPADEIAHCCNTISYELFCQLTARVPRIYIGE